MYGRWIVGLAIAMNLTGCTTHMKTVAAAATDSPTGHAQIGTWGLDLTSADRAVKPGDDFYRYADGNWLDANRIPPDHTSWGSFVELADRAEHQIRAIAESLSPDALQGSTEQKVGDFYRAYLDTEAIERNGLTPAQPGLQAIAAARTHEQLAALMGRPDLDLKSPLGIGITADQKNPDRYIVAITQSGLSLPDRDYYLKDDPVFTQLRAQYVAHVERMLTLAGETDAAAKAASILDIETQIARAHWPAAKRRERDHLRYAPAAAADHSVAG